MGPEDQLNRIRKPIEIAVESLREYKKNCSRRRAAYVEKLIWLLAGDNGYGGALARINELEQMFKNPKPIENIGPQKFVRAGFDHGFGTVTPIV